NEIGGNRVGIKVIGVNSLIFGKNSLDNQAPRLFGGDLQSLGSSIVRSTFAGGLAAVANQCAQPVPPITCSFLEHGLLSGEGHGLLPMLDETNQCIPDSARVPIQLTEGSTASAPEQVSP
ncbi:MAG: hypothetical protein KAG66_13740, partial [Methylococcales bacterium]|nr:hypothetical protein [Methylococcales bacterium]